MNEKKKQSHFLACLETLKMVEFKDKQKDDAICATPQEALQVLQHLIAKQRLASLYSNGNGDAAWNFPYAPLRQFEATEKDLLMAFVLWSKTQQKATNLENDPSKENILFCYNPSKAFRRLRSYVEWMNTHAQGTDWNLDQMMQQAIKTWNVRLAHDHLGRLMLFCELEQVQLSDLRDKIPCDDALRMWAWILHFMLLDANNQHHGSALVVATGKRLGFLESFTCMPLELQAKIDKLTIGTLPIRVQQLHFYNNPTWARFLVALFRPFMSAKMTKRITMIPNHDNPATASHSALGGPAFVPSSSAPSASFMPDLKGTLQEDFLARKFRKSSASPK